MARLIFNYDGIEIKGLNEARQFQDVNGRTCFRDIPKEIELLERLGRAGLHQNTNYMFPDHIVVSPGQRNPRRDWIRFLEQEMQFLEEEGFRIQFEPSFQFRIFETEDWVVSLELIGELEIAVDVFVTIDGMMQSLLPHLADPIVTISGNRSIFSAIPENDEEKFVPMVSEIFCHAMRELPPKQMFERLSVDDIFYLNLPSGGLARMPLNRVQSLYYLLIRNLYKTQSSESLNWCSFYDALALIRQDSMKGVRITGSAFPFLISTEIDTGLKDGG